MLLGRAYLAPLHVIVSVMSGELHAIVTCHAVPCCPYPPVLVPSNSESVVGAWSAHMKMVNRQTWNILQSHQRQLGA